MTCLLRSHWAVAPKGINFKRIVGSNTKKKHLLNGWTNEQTSLSHKQRKDLGRGWLMKTVTMSVLFTMHSFCPTQRPVHRMLKKCWMNEQITNGWPRGLSPKLPHTLKCIWQPKTKASNFTAKTPYPTPYTVTSRSSPVGLRFPPKPGSYSECLYYLPNIHPKYWQKCAIPLLAHPGVIPSYFREYSKNRTSSPTLIVSKSWWMNGFMQIVHSKGLRILSSPILGRTHCHRLHG